MWSCCGWNVVYESFLGSIPTDYRFNFALKYDFKSKRERLSVRFLSKYSLVCTHIHEKDFTGSWFFHVEYTLGRHGRSTKLIHQDGAETYMYLAKSFVELATQTPPILVDANILCYTISGNQKSPASLSGHRNRRLGQKMRHQCANEKHQATTLSSIESALKLPWLFPTFQAIEQRAKGARAGKLAHARNFMKRGWCYEWGPKVDYSGGFFLKNMTRDLAKMILNLALRRKKP